jgi:hypothetical protein
MTIQANSKMIENHLRIAFALLYPEADIYNDYIGIHLRQGDKMQTHWFHVDRVFDVSREYAGMDHNTPAYWANVKGLHDLVERIAMASVHSFVDIKDCTFTADLGKYRAGKEEEVCRTCIVSAEYDCKDVSEVPEVIKLAENFQLQPTEVAYSGGKGVHVRWMLKEPVDLRIPENFRAIKSIRKGLANWINGDVNLASPVHPLGMPGTINRKPGNMKVREVTMLNTSNRYSLTELLAYSAPLEAPRPVYQSDAGSYSGKAPEWMLEALHRQIYELSTTAFQRNRVSNSKAYWLGRRLDLLQMSMHQALDILMDACLQNGYREKDGDNAARKSIESGLKSGMASPITDVRHFNQNDPNTFRRTK